MTTTQELTWVALGTLAWYGIRIFSPKIAGVILAALVISALVLLGSQLATIGKSGGGSAGGW